MGEPMDRFARLNPQRGRLVWAAAAIGAVAIVALTMLLADVADATEIVATLLVAPVCVVALLLGRTPGLAAAAVATLVYAALRQGDMDDAGAAGVLVLVLSRAGVYFLVAYATPILASRLPAGEGPTSSVVSRFTGREREPVGVAAEARAQAVRARELDLHGWVEHGGAAPAAGPGGRYEAGADLSAPDDASGLTELSDLQDLQDLQDDEELSPGPMWEEPLDPALMTPPAGVPGVEEVPWDHPTGPQAVTGNGRRHGVRPELEDAGPGADPGLLSPTPGGWEEPERSVGLPAAGGGPPAPTVPTGWIDDATSPPGDESIPVGYTGELFLPSDLGELPVDEPGLPPTAPPSVPIGNGATHRPPPGRAPRRGEPSLWEEPPPPSPVPPSGGDAGDEPPWGEEPSFEGAAAWGQDAAGDQTGTQPMSWGGEVPGQDEPAWAGDPGGAPRWREDSPGDAGDAGAGGRAWGQEPSSARYGGGPETSLGSGRPARPPFQRPPDVGLESGPEPGPGRPPAETGPYAGYGSAPAGGWHSAAPDRGRREGGGPAVVPPPPGQTGETEAVSESMDPETRLWNARFFRDRLNVERDRAVREGGYFSVVMIQVPDAPFQPLPYRRQVALLRELGHQFIHARLVDHLVHLPDGAQHWFAVVLGGTDRTGAHLIERRLRSAIGGYLRSRGLQVTEIQSASLTSPDDDEAMSAVWSSLLGTSASPS